MSWLFVPSSLIVTVPLTVLPLAGVGDTRLARAGTADAMTGIRPEIDATPWLVAVDGFDQADGGVLYVIGPFRVADADLQVHVSRDQSRP